MPVEPAAASLEVRPMSDVEIIVDPVPRNYSRRSFIKGVVAAGAAVSASGYLFRVSGVLAAPQSARGSVERLSL